MIVGHAGIAFAARALDRRDADSRAPLLWLLAASFAPDIVDGILAAGGYCNPDGVLSHSLPAAALIAAVLGVAAFAHTGRGPTALLVAGLVMLHLPPDYVTGLKGLWPGGPVIGLHLYRWPWIDFLVELPVIVAGWWALRCAHFTPRWVVSGLALAALLTVQASFDLRIQVTGPRTPRACRR